MILSEAKEQFDPDDVVVSTICILVEDHKGRNVAVTSANFNGGYCECCGDGSIDDDVKVLKVVDMNTMETLYSDAQIEDIQEK